MADEPIKLSDVFTYPIYSPEELEAAGLAAQSTLEKWRQEGSGPKHIRIGRKIYYPQVALDEYLHQQMSLAGIVVKKK